jgi:hypothetical protein
VNNDEEYGAMLKHLGEDQMIFDLVKLKVNTDEIGADYTGIAW